MTTMTTTHEAIRRHAGRDDLFTLIHKALRKGLFDVAVLAGRTDWTDPAGVEAFLAEWEPLLALLQSHTRHEDEHLVRPLDGVDAGEAARIDDEHRHLDDLIDAVAASITAAARSGDQLDGLVAYRDLNRFIAAYLPHLHEEETVVMVRIWEARSDEEIAATRGAFMATMTPDDAVQALRMMIAAVDPATREMLATRLTALDG